MNWRPTIDDVLQDLCERGVQCGMATVPGGEMRAWIEVDGALIEGYFDPSPTVSEKIAFWLREIDDRICGMNSRLVYRVLPALVPGVLPGNNVDARSRFLGRRGTRSTMEAFTP